VEGGLAWGAPGPPSLPPAASLTRIHSGPARAPSPTHATQIHALCFFAAHGLSGAASTRVGNDLGAGRPRMAWLTTQVGVLLGTMVMAGFSVVLLLGRHHLGALFSSNSSVVLLTAQVRPGASRGAQLRRQMIRVRLPRGWGSPSA
jgi:hypothetical protein